MAEFTVPGVAQVQGNHRVSKHGYTYDANPRLSAWRQTVALFARRAMAANRSRPYAGPVRLEIEFVMPRTKAMRKDPPPPMVQRPDSLKLARAVEDACAGIVYPDDSFIVDHRITKRRARLGEDPHAKIRCHEVTPETLEPSS